MVGAAPWHPYVRFDPFKAENQKARTFDKFYVCKFNVGLRSVIKVTKRCASKFATFFHAVSSISLTGLIMRLEYIDQVTMLSSHHFWPQ